MHHWGTRSPIIGKVVWQGQKICKPRQYFSEYARNKEWTQEFVAQHLALLVALHSKREAEHNAPTRSSQSKRQKATAMKSILKQTFKKLIGAFTAAIVLYNKEWSHTFSWPATFGPSSLRFSSLESCTPRQFCLLYLYSHVHNVRWSQQWCEIIQWECLLMSGCSSSGSSI